MAAAGSSGPFRCDDECCIYVELGGCGIPAPLTYAAYVTHLHLTLVRSATSIVRRLREIASDGWHSLASLVRSREGRPRPVDASARDSRQVFPAHLHSISPHLLKEA